MIKLNTAIKNTVRGTHKGFKRFLCHCKLDTHTEQESVSVSLVVCVMTPRRGMIGFAGTYRLHLNGVRLLRYVKSHLSYFTV